MGNRGARVIHLLLSVGLLVIDADAAKKPYRYNLDPLTAEELLASLVIKPRLTDKQWKAVLTAKLNSRRGLASMPVTDRTRRVLGGENLWSISRKTLGSPWYWPKIWAANLDITNPHEIEIGRLLAYYRGGETEPPITIPLIRLIPAGGGKSTTLENDTFLNNELKNRFRPPVLIVTDDDAIFGEIRGSYTHRNILYVHENIYVEPYEDAKIKQGQRFAVVRKEKTLRDGTLLGGRTLGELARVVGEVEILRVEEELCVAEVKELVSTMKRGDVLVALPPSYEVSGALVEPPDDLQAKIIQGDESEYSIMGQGQIVLINRGTDDGMQPSFKFRVLRDHDPVTRNQNDVLADYKGEVRIVATSKSASVGFVIRNDEPIMIGDLLVPTQRFPNRPLPPKRPINVLEVD